ncbi:MAG TPA: MarR family winged helix-turn-helix transcriptional regulator [Variovorax sp.]|nr:MarR family winged helix-turn-helix transcriptional regulator [Variovorax sp.]
MKARVEASPSKLDLDTLPGYHIRRLQQIAVAVFLQETEAHGLMLRNASPSDRRVRLLTPTEAGRAVVEQIIPSMPRAQERTLDPLPVSDRAEFMRMLQVLVSANNDLSRAPSNARDS